MIKSFRHTGLEKFFVKGTAAGIQAKHIKKLRLQLAVINTASVIADINKPGWRLHQLNPKKDDIWAIDVNGNWRVTFQFRNGNAFILDYRDYH